MQILVIHLALYWVYLWVFFFLAGFAGLRLLHRFTSNRLSGYRIADITWIGIAVLTWAGMCACLFTPVAGRFHGICAGATLLYAVLDRRALAGYAAERHAAWASAQAAARWRTPAAILLGGAVAMLVLLRANGPCTDYDTYLYHAQSVRWLKTYGTVPGLANLHTRLGFNNSWFVTAALVDAGPFTFKSFHVLNPFLYCFTLLALASRFAMRIGTPLSVSRVFEAVALYPLLRYGDRITSFSTDVPAALLAIYMVAHLLRRHEEPGFKAADLVWVMVMAPFAATVKQAYIPLLLLPVLSWAGIASRECLGFRAIASRAARPAVVYGAFVIAVMAPWLVRNVILSGYLVYPFSAVDVFRFDWKVPRPLILDDEKWIRSWARAPGLHPDIVLQNGMGGWLRNWPARSNPVFLDFMHWLAVGLAMAALFLSHAGSLIRRFWPLAATLAAGMAFWFLQAPDARFGYGYLVASEVFIVALLLVMIVGEGTEHGRKMLGALLAASLLVYLHGEIAGAVQGRPAFLAEELTPFKSITLVPYTYESGLRVNVPVQGDLCGNEPPLCEPGVNRGQRVLSLRNGTIESGFTLRLKSGGAL